MKFYLLQLYCNYMRIKVFPYICISLWHIASDLPAGHEGHKSDMIDIMVSFLENYENTYRVSATIQFL